MVLGAFLVCNAPFADHGIGLHAVHSGQLSMKSFLSCSFCGTFGGSTDPSCSGTMKPDMVLGGNWVWMSPLPPVAVQVTQICKASAAAWPLDNNMALDLRYHMAFSGNRNFRHQSRPWLQ